MNAIDTPSNSESEPAEVDEIIPPQSEPVAVKESPTVIEPTDISKMSTLDELKSGVRSVLQDYEKGRERPEGVRRVDEIWDQVWRVEDTNENLKHIMNQGIVLFQKCYDEFFASLQEDELYLRNIEKEAQKSVGTKDGEANQKLFHAERKRLERKAALAHDNLRGYMDCVVKMSHEYRQCRTQQAFYVHISQLQQFTGLIIAVLHQNIHQADVLKKVSDAIGAASLKLFPVEKTQDS